METQQNRTETPKHVKNTPKKNGIRRKKTKNYEFPPKTTLNSPDLLQNPQSTPIYRKDQREPNKTQRRPQNTSKTPQKRTGSPPKMKENAKYHESTPKVPLNLPDVLQNPQFTLFDHDGHGKNNKTQRRPQNTSKTPRKKTGSEEKNQKTMNFPPKPP